MLNPFFMTDLLCYLCLHIQAWLEAPYSVAISAPSHCTLDVALEFPLMSYSPFFYCLISKLIFSF